MSPVKLIRKKIGELLLERSVITQEQLDKALKEQESNGGYVSQYLISMGFASELEIANCLSSQYGFPYLPLKSYVIPEEVMDLIPLKFIKIYSIVPIDKVGEVLTIAMADPLNDGVIEMLKQITNCDIEVFISTFSDINDTIKRYFGGKLKDITREGINEADLLKEGIIQPFIQTMAHGGAERRKYSRIDVDLGVSFYHQGKSFQATAKNISYMGVFFICDFFIPLDINLLCKIKLNEEIVDTVIQVARVERIKEIQHVDNFEVTKWDYGIAGFFNFITDEDRRKLFVFLKSRKSEKKVSEK